MSEIGFYRVKTLANVAKTITFLKNGIPSGSHNIVPVAVCPENLRVKYIDRNGQYRFIAFENHYSISDQPQIIGTYNKLIADILTDKTDSQNIGYKNTRRMFGSIEINKDQLVYFADIYTSPRVYLYIGSNNSDTAADWLEVLIESGQNIVKRSKGNAGQINIIIELPEYNTINLT